MATRRQALRPQHIYDVELRRPNGSTGKVSIIAGTPSAAKRRAQAVNPRLGIISVKRRR